VPVIARAGAALSTAIAIAFCAAAGAASAAASAADEPAPVADETTKLECLDHHEEAQIARQRRRLRDAQSALRLCSAAACPGIVRADCVDWLDQVSRSLPSVVVTARARGLDLTDVRVTVDGKPAADRLSGAALELDPGEHTFRFEAPPWPPVERTLLISEGVKGRAIDVEFAPPPAPVVNEPVLPPWHQRMTRLDYVVAGLGAAALAASASLGAWALWSRHQLQTSCAPFCERSEVDSVHTKLVLADVALGVALMSAGFVWLRVGWSSDSANSGMVGARVAF
jgi:hypothetical protein